MTIRVFDSFESVIVELGVATNNTYYDEMFYKKSDLKSKKKIVIFESFTCEDFLVLTHLKGIIFRVF